MNKLILAFMLIGVVVLSGCVGTGNIDKYKKTCNAVCSSQNMNLSRMVSINDMEYGQCQCSTTQCYNDACWEKITEIDVEYGK